jgi:plasmid maintenance system killer protein
MKPSSAWALFALILIAVACWMVFSQRHSEAPPDYTALELAQADAAATGSCHSLASVLHANRLEAGASDLKILWTMRVRDEWHLRMERGRRWREFWFTREGDRIVPIQYVVSEAHDRTTLKDAVGNLLAAPALKDQPRVARCAQAQ